MMALTHGCHSRVAMMALTRVPSLGSHDGLVGSPGRDDLVAMVAMVAMVAWLVALMTQRGLHGLCGLCHSWLTGGGTS